MGFGKFFKEISNAWQTVDLTQQPDFFNTTFKGSVVVGVDASNLLWRSVQTTKNTAHKNARKTWRVIGANYLRKSLKRITEVFGHHPIVVFDGQRLPAVCFLCTRIRFRILLAPKSECEHWFVSMHRMTFQKREEEARRAEKRGSKLGIDEDMVKRFMLICKAEECEFEVATYEGMFVSICNLFASPCGLCERRYPSHSGPTARVHVQNKEDSAGAL
jgi:hypothetical protein